MPVIEVNSPFAAAADTLAGYANQKRQNEQDALQKRMLEEQIQERKDTRADALQQRVVQNRLLGLDANGNPLPGSEPPSAPQSQPKDYADAVLPKNAQGHRAPGAPEQEPPSLQTQYQMSLTAADHYRRLGYFELANQYQTAADHLALQVHQANDDAIKFEQEALNKLHIMAEVEHWTKQELEAHRHNVSDEAIRVRAGTLTYDAAMAHVGATMRGQDIEHSDRIRGQDITHHDRVTRVPNDYTTELDNSDIGFITTQLTKGGPKGAAAAIAASTAAGSIKPAKSRAMLEYLHQLTVSSEAPRGQ